jgi:hypothetical protein
VAPNLLQLQAFLNAAVSPQHSYEARNVFPSRVAIGHKQVPVTRVWCILRLQMETCPPIWRVAENILNKQSWTADKGYSSS